MQSLLVAASSMFLAVSLAFLSAGISIMIKLGNPKKIHAYIYFVIGFLFVLLFAFFWQAVLIQNSQITPPPNTPKEVNDMWPFWLSAIGTTLLAAITFYVSVVKPWRERPSFTIEFDNKEPYCRKLGAPESYWLRLKVTNSGKSVAKRCSGRLVEFIGDSRELETHDLVQLHWINTPWSAQEFFPPIDLNRGEHDFLDVLVTRPEHQGKPLLFMSPDNLFSKKPDEVPQGTCRIQVTVYGDNVKPCPKEYSISWEGKDPKYTDIRLKEEK